jgi:hypothetical protein
MPGLSLNETFRSLRKTPHVVTGQSPRAFRLLDAFRYVRHAGLNVHERPGFRCLNCCSITTARSRLVDLCEDLGHRSISITVRYTELSATKFKAKRDLVRGPSAYGSSAYATGRNPPRENTTDDRREAAGCEHSAPPTPPSSSGIYAPGSIVVVNCSSISSVGSTNAPR